MGTGQALARESMPDHPAARYAPVLQQVLRITQRVRVSVGGTATQQMLVAMLGHPVRPPQMAVPAAVDTLGIGRRVAVEHDPGDLTPVRTVGLGVQQTQIRDEVLFVIAGETGRFRGAVSDGRIKRGLLHGKTDQVGERTRRTLACRVSLPEVS